MKAVGGGGDHSTVATADRKPSAKERRQRKVAALRLARYARDMRAGRPAVDPLVWSGKAYERKLREAEREARKRKARRR